MGKTKGLKKVQCVVFSVVMVLGVLFTANGRSVKAQTIKKVYGDFTVISKDSNLSTSVELETGAEGDKLVFTTGAEGKSYTITQTNGITNPTTDRIVVKTGTNDEPIKLTLDGVNICTDEGPAMDIAENSVVHLTLKENSENALISTSIGSAGLQVQSDSSKVAKVTINGKGNLTAKGGTNGAGIGSGDEKKCGAIIIKDGNITALAGKYGAGIGGGHGCAGGNITILGGSVIAQSPLFGAGIGGGYHGTAGNIFINNMANVIAASDGKKNAIDALESNQIVAEETSGNILQANFLDYLDTDLKVQVRDHNGEKLENPLEHVVLYNTTRSVAFASPDIKQETHTLYVVDDENCATKQQHETLSNDVTAFIIDEPGINTFENVQDFIPEDEMPQEDPLENETPEDETPQPRIIEEEVVPEEEEEVDKTPIAEEEPKVEEQPTSEEEPVLQKAPKTGENIEYWIQWICQH